ncbi:hypothetical protein [Gephyromycinifex aptenodytis]|uniref:hypothetical protein n=1 Tax=Gephyromycinifex aptenodytis TaxID=2716227 RepID=UPI0014486291|nr:hypothetical protein [Gephyromycinifex aptenodytis]
MTDPTDFAAALRAAISARGLSLDQIRRGLARHGITVSVATLSYWQSGRSRPERASSLAAIGPLEELLELPRGFLGSRLPPSRRLSAESLEYSSSFAELDSGKDGISAAVAELGLSYDDGFAGVSVHDRVDMRADRSQGPRYVRTVMTAQREGLDRFPVWVYTDETAAYPIVTAVANCRIGRIREFPELRGVAAEVILDRALHIGETTLVEHCIELVGQEQEHTYLLRSLVRQTRELVLEARFSPKSLPVRVWEVTELDGVTRRRDLPVYPAVQALFTDCVPGKYTLMWEWE